MEDAELGGRSRLVGAAQDADAGRGSAVAVQVLVSPDLRALVEPRTDAVAVVPVGQQDRGHLDLAVERLLEHGAHLGGGPRVVAGVDDDPAVRSFDRKTAPDAPATHRIHAVGDLFDVLLVADAPLVVGEQRGARRDRAVRPDDGLAAQGWTTPRVSVRRARRIRRALGLCGCSAGIWRAVFPRRGLGPIGRIFFWFA